MQDDKYKMDTVNNRYNKVKKYIEKHHMIEERDLVVAGVSGGADSVCLLHVLWKLSKELDYRLVVVHVDHGVRAESAEDGAYVEHLCREMALPFYLRKVDMSGYAKEQGISSEEAGRKLRYDVFEEILCKERRKLESCKIAVAHNANDRAETMLFHMFRGSGLKGLSSIRPVRDIIIRPLLCMEREEIEDYLERQGIAYCQDSTNESDLYTRNKIRHNILPYAGQEICSGAVMHMGELADILTETEDYLEKQTKKLYRKYVEEFRGNRTLKLHIRVEELQKEDSVMCKRVLLMCMECLTPYRKDITSRHIADLMGLMVKEGSKELSLPYGIRAYKEYGTLILCHDVDKDADSGKDCGWKYQEYIVEPPAEILVPYEGAYIFTLLENADTFRTKQQNIPENRYTKWFDYDKITTTLFLRTRRQGDYLTIDAALHTKSVKQYMINEKIPKIRRDSMYILADGSHVMWIPGYRISQRYKVDENTTRILQVQLRGGCHGGTN